MKKLLCLLVALCLVGSVRADLVITNGDFEEGGLTANQNDVLSWFDSAGNSDNTGTDQWWSGSWYGPGVSPTGTSGVGFSAWNSPWIFQNIGVNDLGRTDLEVTLTIGSFTDAAQARDLEVLVEIYQPGSGFVPEEAVDIADSYTALDSFSITGTGLEAGDTVTDSGTLDLSGANATDAIYLRISNPKAIEDNSSDNQSWVGVDNVSIPSSVNVVAPVNDPSGTIPVPVTQTLEWNVVMDGIEYVDIYLADATEPNLSNDPGTKVLDYAPVATTTFTPSNLEYSTQYYWKVVMYKPDGNGGYMSGSGPVWSFLTVDEQPTIGVVEPVITVVEAGEPAIIKSIGVNVNDYQWYKVGDSAPLLNGDDYDGVTTDTLTVKNVQVTDEGYFYCVGTNSVGTASNEETGTGRVMVRRMVNHYKMDITSTDGKSVPNEVAGSPAMELVSDDEVVVGYPVLDTDVVDPVLGSSLNIVNLAENDPNGQYGQLPAGDINLADMTVSVWVKWTGTGSYQRIFDFGNSTSEYMYLATNVSNRMRFGITTVGGADEEDVLTSDAALSTDTWTFVTLTLSGDTGKLYVNGELEDTNTSMPIDPIDFKPANNYFGKSQWADPFFNGFIDDVKIYNYARTTEEVAHDYLDVIGGWVCNNEVDALPYDYNDDCEVNVADFAVFAATWLDSNRIYE